MAEARTLALGRMKEGKSRSWIVVVAIFLLVMTGGLAVVMGISLAVHGGSVDAIIEMLEYAALVLAALVGTIVLIFASVFIAHSIGDAFDRWRNGSLPDKKSGNVTATRDRTSLSWGIFGLLFIVVLSVIDHNLLVDIARMVTAFAVLVAVCWCCVKIDAIRRTWREHGRQWRWRRQR